MTAVGLLSRLVAGGIELRARSGSLIVRGHGAGLDPATMAEIRTHKPELLALLDGSTCRWCRGLVAWHGASTVALADGTSLHEACREPFDLHRITAVAEVVIRAELPGIEQGFAA